MQEGYRETLEKQSGSLPGINYELTAWREAHQVLQHLPVPVPHAKLRQPFPEGADQEVRCLFGGHHEAHAQSVHHGQECAPLAVARAAQKEHLQAGRRCTRLECRGPGCMGCTVLAAAAPGTEHPPPTWTAQTGWRLDLQPPSSLWGPQCGLL